VETKNPNYRMKLEHAFADAPFVAENGIRLVACEPGWCESAIELTPHHRQHLGMPHGGLIATLADHTSGGAAATLIANDEHVLNEAEAGGKRTLISKASVTLAVVAAGRIV